VTIHKRQGATREELFCGIGMPNPDSLRQWAEFLSLDEYIKSTPNAPEEKIDEVDMNTLLKIKRRFIDDAV
jgi:hypothetical protein